MNICQRDDHTGIGHRLGLAAAAVLVAGAVAFRIVGLDHLPGVNGDEAYYGALVLALTNGRQEDWVAATQIPLDPYPVTATGLPLNPFYSGLLFLFHRVWPEPSFWILRMPAVLSGLVLLGLAYPLLKQVFDRETALGTTLLLTCLPITIAYSRFGWDQSQAPLAALLCLYFALKRQLVWAGVAFIFSWLIHPLNVFLAPVLLGPKSTEWLVQCWTSTTADQRRRFFLGGVLLLVAPVLLVGVGIRLMDLPSYLAERLRQDLPEIAKRLFSPAHWLEFALLYGDFLAGTTIYRYLVGGVPYTWVLTERLLFWSLVLSLVVIGIPSLVRQRNLQALGLLAGLGVSLAALAILGGTVVISVSHERYLMALVPPSCLALVLLGRQLGASAQARRRQGAGLLLVCGLLLAGFFVRYFLPLLKTGGMSHHSARTGPVEPKQAAFEAILQKSQGQPAVVLAEDWWCFYPLLYFASDHPEIRVLELKQVPPDLNAERYFVVGFAEGTCERWLKRNAPNLVPDVKTDFRGRPIVLVWDLPTDVRLRFSAAAPALLR